MIHHRATSPMSGSSPFCSPTAPMAISIAAVRTASTPTQRTTWRDELIRPAASCTRTMPINFLDRKVNEPRVTSEHILFSSPPAPLRNRKYVPFTKVEVCFRQRCKLLLEICFGGKFTRMRPTAPHNKPPGLILLRAVRPDDRKMNAGYWLLIPRAARAISKVFSLVASGPAHLSTCREELINPAVS